MFWMNKWTPVTTHWGTVKGFLFLYITYMVRQALTVMDRMVWMYPTRDCKCLNVPGICIWKKITHRTFNRVQLTDEHVITEVSDSCRDISKWPPVTLFWMAFKNELFCVEHDRAVPSLLLSLSLQWNSVITQDTVGWTKPLFYTALEESYLRVVPLCCMSGLAGIVVTPCVFTRGVSFWKGERKADSGFF
jgi:hypothetical protein